MAGRGMALPHSQVDHEGENIPVISWDYGFIGTRGPGSSSTRPTTDDGDDLSSYCPILCARDRLSESCFWYYVPRKGLEFASYPNLAKVILEDLDGLGYSKVVCRSDGEPSIVAVLKDLKSRWAGDMRLENSPEGDHDSAGNAECGVGLMKGHVRTLKLNLERRLRQEIAPNHPLMPWIVKHASCTYRRYVSLGFGWPKPS